MSRMPRIGGTLAYAAAWLVPWRSVMRVRSQESNFEFIVHRRDVIGRHIAKYGAHEPALTRWIARHLAASPSGLFVDVGANMGWHALHAAKQAAVKTVVAFEPDAFNASLLDQNLSMNNIHNVVVLACALGARSGLAKLYRYKASNLGRHSLINNHGRGTRLIPLLALDDALELLGVNEQRIIVLKVDVEGYEPAVIEGACQALTRTDVIILECSPSLSRAGNLSIDGMVDQLDRCGFMANSLEYDGRVTPFDAGRLNAIEGQMDVIWMRKT